MNELRRSHSLLQEIQARTRAIQLDATDTRVRLGELATKQNAEKADARQQAAPPLNEALPDDGLLHICRCLPATDLLLLGQCCKALHLLVQQNRAGWAELCHQRFGCSTDLSCVPRMRWDQVNRHCSLKCIMLSALCLLSTYTLSPHLLVPCVAAGVLDRPGGSQRGSMQLA